MRLLGNRSKLQVDGTRGRLRLLDVRHHGFTRRVFYIVKYAFFKSELLLDF
jgi:hypothetical protein